jgi:hypothetical protein
MWQRWDIPESCLSVEYYTTLHFRVQVGILSLLNPGPYLTRVCSPVDALRAMSAPLDAFDVCLSELRFEDLPTGGNSSKMLLL